MILSKNKDIAQRVWLLIAMLGVQFLFILTVILVAAYEQPDSGMTYTTPLSARLLFSWMTAVTLHDLRRVLSAEVFVFLALSWFAIFTHLTTLRQTGNPFRCTVFVSQCLILYWGWIGLYLLPFDVFYIVRGRMDCEWLGESSPIYEAVGLWLCVSAIEALMDLGHIRSRRRNRCPIPAN